MQKKRKNSSDIIGKVKSNIKDTRKRKWCTGVAGNHKLF